MKFVRMNVPYIFSVLTCVPIFVLIFIVPVSADTELFQMIEMIIDHYLFGKVGMWSSTFPLGSKIITNYWCLVMPVFSAVFTYRVLQLSNCQREMYHGHSIRKLIFLIAAMVLMLVFFLYISYVDNTDLASAGRRFAVLGKYKVTYALFVSGILIAAYMLMVVSYIIFRFFPPVILARIRATK